MQKCTKRERWQGGGRGCLLLALGDTSPERDTVSGGWGAGLDADGRGRHAGPGVASACLPAQHPKEGEQEP